MSVALSVCCIVELILRLMTCILARVGVSVNESDPLNIVTDMMIDIGKVFLRLTILALLVSETRERRALRDVDALDRLDTLHWALGNCTHTI
jgi:hypothetical protein